MHWTSRLLKCPFVPLNGRGLALLEPVLQKLRPAATICDSQAHAERAEQLLKSSDVPCIKIYTNKPPTMPGWNDLEDFALSSSLDTAKIDLLVSPMILEDMIQHPSFSQRSTTSVFIVALTYDVITKRTVRKAAEAFLSARIICGHGMTEGGSDIFQWPRDVPGPLHGPCWQGIASVGKINSGFGVRVVGCDREVLQKGQIGELHLSGSSFTASYLDDGSQDMFYTNEQGTRFRTGDAGVIDDNDFVYILGRQNDMVRCRNGLVIPPASIEDCIAGFLDCQVAVLRVNNGGGGGQAPFAVVGRLGEKIKADIKEHFHKTLDRLIALPVSPLLRTWVSIHSRQTPLSK